MLEVIGVGYGRTGTFSLKHALEHLGFGPCYHAYELMNNPSHVARWERVLAGAPNWDEVFEGYRSTTDFPSVTYWRELIDYCPDAKVILTIRDVRQWYDSVRKTVLAEMEPGGQIASVRQDDDHQPGFARLMAAMMEGNDDDYHDEAHMIAKFEQHNADVQAYVRAERLLVFEIQQGWGPLCEFLGVDVPDQPFPRVNEADAFKAEVAKHTSGPK